MLIKNINGVEEKACGCESPLIHWGKYSGQSPSLCPVSECLNTLEVGAQVQKENPKDKGWYIIPLCLKHNAMTGDSLPVNDKIELVSVKVRKACGPRTS